MRAFKPDGASESHHLPQELGSDLESQRGLWIAFSSKKAIGGVMATMELKAATTDLYIVP